MELNFTTYAGLSILAVFLLMYFYTLKTNNDALLIMADEIKALRKNNGSSTETLTSGNSKPKRKINPDLDD